MTASSRLKASNGQRQQQRVTAHWMSPTRGWYKDVSVSYIYREANIVADYLAKLGRIKVLKEYFFFVPREGALPLLQRNLEHLSEDVYIRDHTSEVLGD
ncbi:hypothetical protein V6N12_058873 [Hibiscus sabdariffa]|uniref:RNase H type-1 domain-containing protein n=1 Tax=Hibiscus sabdariffa TaxID=183260 RepID=A0ABR2EW77_9ROSI